MQIVDGKDYLSEVKDLIIEYSQRLGRDLSFQNMDDELQDPSHKYTAPEGEMLVAIENAKVIGMVAYHRHSDVRCEMKRLYVKPETRGMHLGDSLVEAIIEQKSCWMNRADEMAAVLSDRFGSFCHMNQKVV